MTIVGGRVRRLLERGVWMPRALSAAPMDGALTGQRAPGQGLVNMTRCIECLSMMMMTIIVFSSLPVPASADAGGANATPKGAAPSPLDWGPCSSGQGDESIECTVVTVPLDHSDPSAGSTAVRVGRIPATGGAAKGAIFYNPGGPGLSPVEGLASFAARLSPQVRGDHDIIGVDPRGVGGSEAIPCGAITTEPPSTSYSVFPSDPGQLAEQFDVLDPWLRATCDSASPLLKHVGSIDAARDIEQVRGLLGIDRIDYYGISYGAVIGAVYSRLFPAHLRSLTLDSPADPNAWFGAGRPAPLWARLGTAEYGEATLEDLFIACESAGGRCQWAPTIRSDYEHVTGALRTERLTVPGTVSFDASAFQSTVVGALYRFNQSGGDDYETLFRLIHALAQVADGTAPDAEPALADSAIGPQARAGLGVLSQDATVSRMLTVDAVVCADAHEPSWREAWLMSATAAEADSPGFGYYWISQDSICNGWPVTEDLVEDSADALRGGTIDVPFLVLSNAHDPVVGEWDADRVGGLGPRGEAVVVTDGWGHGVLRSCRARPRSSPTTSSPASLPDHRPGAAVTRRPSPGEPSPRTHR